MLKRLASTIFSVALGTATAFAAGDTATCALKDVTSVSYSLWLQEIFEKSEKTGTEKTSCKPDWNAWNTSMDFVANQSSQLKLIKSSVKLDNVFNAKVPTPDRSDWNKAMDDLRKYGGMPDLTISIYTVNTGFGCVGQVEAQLKAALHPSQLLATERVISDPHVEIWSRTGWLIGPYSDFPPRVVQTAEGMMKSFVNTWAESQRLTYCFSP